MNTILKSTLTAVLLTVALIGMTIPAGSSAVAQAQAKTVYICTGEYSTAYHATKTCRGLGNCKANIISVTREKAVSMKRTPCKVCKAY